MDGGKSPRDDALRNVFLGSLSSQFDELENNKAVTLAHYTSARVLLEILSTKQVWMRNARCMNDFSEIDYAVGLVRQYFNDEKRQKRFQETCNKCHPSSFEELGRLLDGHLPSIYNHTYITCLSLHGVDDSIGRLSMWRGYGGSDVAAAVVVNKETVVRDGPYGLQGYPVQYYRKEEFFAEIDGRVDIIEKNIDEIASAPFNNFRSTLFGVFQVLLATIKHPGFSEENEWRLLYTPNLYPSKDLEKTKIQVTLNGMPQSVYKIPIDGEPFNEGRAATIDNLVGKIIIGPCNEAGVAVAAIQDALKNAHHRSAESIVHFCGIPYRERV